MLSGSAQTFIEQPQACFQSTSTMMSSGSTYTPEVYPIGANSPSAAPSGPRRVSGLGTDDSGYQGGNNPQFSPIGDAVIPLLIMALTYMLVAYRRKTKVSDLCI